MFKIKATLISIWPATLPGAYKTAPILPLTISPGSIPLPLVQAPVAFPCRPTFA